MKRAIGIVLSLVMVMSLCTGSPLKSGMAAAAWDEIELPEVPLEEEPGKNSIVIDDVTYTWTDEWDLGLDNTYQEGYAHISEAVNGITVNFTGRDVYLIYDFDILVGELSASLRNSKASVHLEELIAANEGLTLSGDKLPVGHYEGIVKIDAFDSEITLGILACYGPTNVEFTSTTFKLIAVGDAPIEDTEPYDPGEPFEQTENDATVYGQVYTWDEEWDLGLDRTVQSGYAHISTAVSGVTVDFTDKEIYLVYDFTISARELSASLRNSGDTVQLHEIISNNEGVPLTGDGNDKLPVRVYRGIAKVPQLNTEVTLQSLACYGPADVAFESRTFKLVSVVDITDVEASGGDDEPSAEPVEVVIHTDRQAEYLQGDYNDISHYAGGVVEQSMPLPVRLTWGNKLGAVSYHVKVSESDTFDNAWEYDTATPRLFVYNSKIDTTYYWMVTTTYKNDTSEDSAIRSYRVAAESPRNLYVPGLTNVRDLGGWRTTEGAVLRQGLLYRGGRLDTSGAPKITADGIEVFTEQLGIKTEIDLRLTTESQITESTAGVTYVAAPMNSDAMMSEDNNKELLKVFQILADESNYPIYFHCSIGTDRTGYVAYLVNGLLGVAENDLYRDYLFSNFGQIGSSRALSNLQNAYGNAINTKYAGDTLRERIEAYLLDLGVTKEEIDSIRRILTGAAPESLPGDINGDGKITVADYGLTLAHVRGTKLLDGDALAAADVNGDGKVTVADYGLILAHVRGTKKLF